MLGDGWRDIENVEYHAYGDEDGVLGEVHPRADADEMGVLEQPAAAHTL